ncbi:unnamed protein product, partial [Didymodactylos carnosus]
FIIMNVDNDPATEEEVLNALVTSALNDLQPSRRTILHREYRRKKQVRQAFDTFPSFNDDETNTNVVSCEEESSGNESVDGSGTVLEEGNEMWTDLQQELFGRDRNSQALIACYLCNAAHFALCYNYYSILFIW